MNNLKKLNLGCGQNFHSDWINIDFASTGENVINHNLLEGIPFSDNEFDVVYHSHVLEHFSKKQADFFLEECYRVLKPNGIIRIAVPDLEQIAKLYIEKLNAIANGNEDSKFDYDWIMLELLDQSVRTKTGGDMLNYLAQNDLKNETFVIERLGFYAKNIIDSCKNFRTNELAKKRIKFKNRFKDYLRKKLFGDDLEYIEIGKFAMSGELHRWMYDKYSLSELLKKHKFVNIASKTAFDSDIDNFASYNLDVINNKIIKADSLFIEAKK